MRPVIGILGSIGVLIGLLAAGCNPLFSVCMSFCYICLAASLDPNI